MTIHTRQTDKGTYWCNATINGYDYSFEGDNAELARDKMRQQIRRMLIDPEKVKWEAVEVYKGTKLTTEKDRKSIYTRPWLDFLR